MINEQLDGQLRMATLDPLEGKQLQVRKRDGRIIEFDETRIYLALEAALKADAGLEQDEPAPESMQADAQLLTHEVVERCLVRLFTVRNAARRAPFAATARWKARRRNKCS